MDFTLDKYSELLKALLGAGYRFETMASTMTMTSTKTMTQTMTMTDDYVKTVCLRHDVDLKPQNSLKTAKIEAKMGIRATYYFRAVPESWDEQIIKEIAALGHEIGYHYESLTTCNGNKKLAYEDFCMNLERLRKLADVTTICMHGSPRSPYDSKELWRATMTSDHDYDHDYDHDNDFDDDYDYHTLGIVGEPYLDTDWSKTFYLTDTGRRWDGYNVSVRDKIPHWQDVWNEQGLTFHTTDDIIKRANSLPQRIMITTHPQRWNDNMFQWAKELLLQNTKNIIKSLLINEKK